MKVVDTAEGTGIHREKSCSSRIGTGTITAIVFDIYRDGAISHSRVQRETINGAVRAETNRGERVSATSSPSGRRRNLIKRLLAACRCLSTFRHPPDIHGNAFSHISLRGRGKNPPSLSFYPLSFRWFRWKFFLRFCRSFRRSSFFLCVPSFVHFRRCLSSILWYLIGFTRRSLTGWWWIIDEKGIFLLSPVSLTSLCVQFDEYRWPKDRYLHRSTCYVYRRSRRPFPSDVVHRWRRRCFTGRFGRIPCVLRAKRLTYWRETSRPPAVECRRPDRASDWCGWFFLGRGEEGREERIKKQRGGGEEKRIDRFTARRNASLAELRYRDKIL